MKGRASRPSDSSRGPRSAPRAASGLRGSARMKQAALHLAKTIALCCGRRIRAHGRPERATGRAIPPAALLVKQGDYRIAPAFSSQTASTNGIVSITATPSPQDMRTDDSIASCSRPMAVSTWLGV